MGRRIMVVVAERGLAERRAAAAAGTAPRWDVCAVIDALAAPVVSYDDGVSDRRRLCSLALERSNPGDLLVCFGEDVAFPLLTLGKLHPPRRVFTIAHSLAPLKKLVMHHQLWGDRVAGLVVYNELQRQLAEERLGWPADLVHRIPFQTDQRFYVPATGRPQPANGPVVSVGGEHRDWPTLLAACAGLPVETSMGSAWARQSRQAAELPPNVVNRRRSWEELRQLYHQATAVVVPLLPCEFPAGISSALEAMACAAPVIVTDTAGLNGVLPEDTVRRVPPGDADALRAAIDDLRRNPAAAQSLGRRARFWVEEHATLEAFVMRFAGWVLMAGK